MARIEKEEGTKGDVEIIERLDEIAAQGPIGQVKFASGYRLLENRRRMDWALVELDPTLPVQNLLPMETQFSEECFHGVPENRSRFPPASVGTEAVKQECCAAPRCGGKNKSHTSPAMKGVREAFEVQIWYSRFQYFKTND
ncbi:hypothetical protein VC83_02807 [Pseudogymnoascus destructans]|uniref:Uncharacterized protein n=1 Tax=Pseudogymnoascus destructans TaxID=655981 RepID=A0A177AFW5_9PEZI|nr:uncharacterized protein VC83_02807 [Pseudogymnoascus destructans]OAF60302.1 hypothetical protein VC83_02807 [Pseudogymnoascus destructans]